ncbi:MAG: hypothetical protein Q9186_003896 [Xanthomendoza sp. 1 TL-2023]
MAASIYSFVYKSWIDTANRPITQNIAQRGTPFGQFDFHFYPSLRQGAALTPVKTGLTFVTILDKMASAPRWPTHVRAIMSEGVGEQEIKLGRIDIDNDPEASKSVATDRGANNPIAQILRHRWLRCLVTTTTLPLARSPQGFVTDHPKFSPKPEVSKYSLSCGNQGAADRIDLFIYPAANRGSPQQLTWRDMMRWLIIWIARFAADMDEGRSAGYTVEGVLLAEISVFIQPGVGSDQSIGGIATA